MTRLQFRPACSSDAALLSAMMCRAIAETNAVDYPPEVIAKLVARHTVGDVSAMIDAREVFSATEREVIVGTIALEGDQLRGLFVEPARQGAGIGGLLVAHLEEHAAALGLEALWLQSSVTALNFYARRGYEAERFIERDDGSVTIMRKRLRS